MIKSEFVTLEVTKTYGDGRSETVYTIGKTWTINLGLFKFKIGPRVWKIIPLSIGDRFLEYDPSWSKETYEGKDKNYVNSLVWTINTRRYKEVIPVLYDEEIVWWNTEYSITDKVFLDSEAMDFIVRRDYYRIEKRLDEIEAKKLATTVVKEKIRTLRGT